MMRNLSAPLILTMCVLLNMQVYAQSCFITGTPLERRWSYRQNVGFLNDNILGAAAYNPDPAISTQHTIRISLHIITDSNGNQGVPVTKLTQDTLLLQDALGQANLEFTLFFQDTIANDAYFPTLSIAEQEAISMEYNIPNTVNIYYAKSLDNTGNGVATFSPVKMAWFNSYTTCPRYGQYIFIETNSTVSTLAHEMGHYFDLFHTYEFMIDSVVTTVSNFEYGDLIPDTPWAQDEAYDCDSGDEDSLKLAKNFMSATSAANDCRSEFRFNQRRVIRYTLLNHRPELLAPPPLRFTNEINGENAGGNLKVTQNSIIDTIPSGNFSALQQNQNATVETLNERFGNWQSSGVDYKHHHWNNLLEIFHLTETFQIQLENDAKFFDLNPVTIQNHFISENRFDQSIEFRDPWYVDENGNQPDVFFTFTSPHQPTGSYHESSGGVFLDQLVQPGNPHYAVRAEDEYTLGGTDYFFVKWGGKHVMPDNAGALSTAVTFTDENAELNALYKGRMVSSVAAATAGNNGRRIAKDADGGLHLVYADGGQIWYTFSGDQGENWTQEILAGPGYEDAPAGSPAITIAGDDLHLAYSVDVGAAVGFPGLAYEIHYTQKAFAAGSWQTPGHVMTSGFDPPAASLPVSIGIWERANTTPHVAIAANEDYGGNPRAKTAYREAGSNALWKVRELDGSNPALATRSPTAGLSHIMDIVYEWNNELYLSRWDSANWQPPICITEEIAGEVHRNPSVSMRKYGGQTYTLAAWEIAGEDEAAIGYQVIRYQQPSLATVTIFPGIAPGHPSVSEWGVGAHWPLHTDVTIFYEDQGKIWKRIQKGASSWWSQSAGPGREPNAAAHGHSGRYLYDAGAVFSRDTSAPYRIYADYQVSPIINPPPTEKLRFMENNSSSVLIPMDSLAVHKRLELSLPGDSINGAFAALEIKNPFVGSRALILDEALTSGYFTVDASHNIFFFEVDCRFHYSQAGADSCDRVWELQFWEGEGAGIPLASLNYGDLLPYNSGNTHTFSQTIDLSALMGRSGVLKFELSDFSTEIYDVVEQVDSTVVERMKGVKGKFGKESLTAALPKKFALAQNYPNPFNPATMISYDLPKAANVKIHIYDIRGKRVKTLLNRQQDAGTYDITWNGVNDHGNSVASGVYLYRMVSDGFVKTRKMILMR